MNLSRKTMSLVVAISASTLIAGCPTATLDRTANQGGGSVITAGAKIASGKIGSLTPDELQLMHDKAIQLNPELAAAPELTDEQAAAAVEFLDANGLDTLDDVVELIEDASENPDTIVIPESVQAVLEGIVG